MSIIIKGGSSTNLADVTAAGELKTTGTLMSATGQVATFRPDGQIFFAQDPSGLFFDAFEMFNLTDMWATSGTAPTLGTGNLTFGSSTTTNAFSVVRSQPVFSLASVMYLQVTFILAYETGAITGNKRFWGLGYPQGSPSAGTPLSSGVVFELNDTDGNLYGAVYSNGARTNSVLLGRPTDGLVHRYSLYHRTSRVYFTVDGATVGSIAYPNPASAAMPVTVGSVNASTAVSSAPLLVLSQVSVGDTSRNNQQISDGTFPWRRAQVGKNGGLSVKGAAFAATSATFAAGATGTLGPIDVSEAGNVTFLVKNTVPGTAFTGNPVLQLEQSDDGVSWAALPSVRSDTGVVQSTATLSTNTANHSIAIDAAVEGINWVRARVTNGPTLNSMTVVCLPGGMPFSPAVALVQPARTNVLVSAAAAAVGALDGLVAMNRTMGTTVGAAATSWTITAARRFRITSMQMSQMGNTGVATTASTILRFRYNATGAVTTSSPVLFTARVGTPALAGAFSSVPVTIPDGLELAGDGVAQWGISAASTFASNAPTIDILVAGYEY